MKKLVLYIICTLVYILPLLAAHDKKYSLHYAVAKRDLRKVKKIISWRFIPRINEKNEYGLTPLHIATECGYKEIAEFLLTKNANIEEREKNGWTPLFYAVKEGHKELVDLFIEKKANIEVRDSYRWNLLHVAAYYGRKKIVKYLIYKKMNINAKGINGWTPLHSATSCGNKEIVEILVEKGADPTIKNKDGNFPLDIVCSKKCKKKNIEEFLKKTMRTNLSIYVIAFHWGLKGIFIPKEIIKLITKYHV